MSKADERSRRQWIKIADQVRFVPAGRLPEDLGIDMRSAVELPREPAPFELFVGMSGRSHVHAARRAQHEEEARRNKRQWHDDMEHRVAALENRLSRMEGS
ncbi:MAG TPA: hypothetical protein VMS43_13895 [Allosphingosinicella sp.]|nr:hypothetical protein [Allosphingosinicella sp.]